MIPFDWSVFWSVLAALAVAIFVIERVIAFHVRAFHAKRAELEMIARNLLRDDLKFILSRAIGPLEWAVKTLPASLMEAYRREQRAEEKRAERLTRAL